MKSANCSILVGIRLTCGALRKAETGDYQALPNQPPGNGHKITDWEKFREFARIHGHKTQVQMAQLWDGEISDRTISRALKKIGWTRKKRLMATENGMKVNDRNIVAALSNFPLKSIVYVDESGMDSREQYDYGWNPKGERFFALKSGKRQGRINMIAALCNGKLMAPFTVEGSCNRIVFELWLENCLLPTLQAGQVVVMDNATFHKGGQIQQLIKDAGCQLLYLPPYSPDLNPIEKCWSWLKSRIRHQLERFDCLRDAIESVLRTVS